MSRKDAKNITLIPAEGGGIAFHTRREGRFSRHGEIFKPVRVLSEVDEDTATEMGFRRLWLKYSIKSWSPSSPKLTEQYMYDGERKMRIPKDSFWYDASDIYTKSGLSFLEWYVDERTEWDSDEEIVKPKFGFPPLSEHIRSTSRVRLHWEDLYTPSNSLRATDFFRYASEWVDVFHKDFSKDIQIEPDGVEDIDGRDGDVAVYVIRLLDGERNESLYVGESFSPSKRIKKHAKGNGAKATKNRRVVGIEEIEWVGSKSAAKDREREKYEELSSALDIPIHGGR